MDVVWLVIGLAFGFIVGHFIAYRAKTKNIDGKMGLVISERGTGVEVKFDKIEFQEGDIVRLLFIGERSELDSQEDSGL